MIMETMKEFKKRMHEYYVRNMKMYGKEVLPYREWLKMVNETKIDKK